VLVELIDCGKKKKKQYQNRLMFGLAVLVKTRAILLFQELVNLPLMDQKAEAEFSVKVKK
jgi:hypothetical protein